MKTAFFTIILITILLPLQAQDTYVVQNVKGIVRKGRQILRKGIKIKSNEKIKFSKGAYLMVSSQKYGRMILPPASTKPEINYAFSDLLPQSKRTSTKNNIVVINHSLEWKSIFGSHQYRIYGNRLEVNISPDYEIMDEKHFFFFQFKHPSERELVSKKLAFKGQQLIINKGDLFSIEGMAIDPKDCSDFALYFYDSEKKDFPKLADFQPVFVDDADLSAFAQTRLSFLDQPISEISYKTLLLQLEDFIKNTYGESTHNNLGTWIHENLDIEKFEE